MSKKIFPLFALLLFLLVSCNLPAGTPPVPTPTVAGTNTTETPAAAPQLSPVPVQLRVGRGIAGSWFEIYFTDPNSPQASLGVGGVDGPLGSAIDSARSSIDAAIYALTLNTIRSALLRAHSRGVQVRLVMENANVGGTDPQALIEAGIPVVIDSADGVMHNTFLVIDRSEVWTGSADLTNASIYKAENNLLRIRSEAVAEDYTKEFEEMFVDKKFGADIVAATPYQHVNIEGTNVSVYFAPDDDVQVALIDLISQAKKSIYFMAESFTASKLAEAIRLQAASGVTVKGVMDASGVTASSLSEFGNFRNAGIEVRKSLDAGEMRNNVLIIDEHLVMVGSYNFTTSAQNRNDENILILDNPFIAAEFLAQFQQIFDQAKP
jgi:phosphatidylserine/phosphatidylglycerophosphate/cardiolipin synthase-like enzyme